MDKITYFNNAATTFPKPEEVYIMCDDYLRNYGVSIGRNNFISNKNLVDETRELLLELFHCTNKKVVFTNTATESLNIIIRGLVTSNDLNIYVSPFEHNAVMRVLHYLESLYDINLITLSVDKKSLTYNLDVIESQFKEHRPDVVIISHVSNVCGLIAPIESICKMSNTFGAVNVIDMCQSAGLIDFDLSSEIYNFSVFAGHKTLYAPYGVSGFICSDNLVLSPLMYGGTGIDSKNMELPKTIPERYEVGSQNIVAISGLNAALKWVKKIGIDNVFLKEKENYYKLLKILNDFDNIKIIETNEVTSVGVVSCIFEDYSSDNIGQIFQKLGIEVRTGLHCSPFAHKFLGTFPSGTVRFSVSYFNDDEDFKNLVKALEYIYENSY